MKAKNKIPLLAEEMSDKLIEKVKKEAANYAEETAYSLPAEHQTDKFLANREWIETAYFYGAWNMYVNIMKSLNKMMEFNNCVL